MKINFNVEGAVWRFQELIDRNSFMRRQLKYDGQYIERHTVSRFDRPLWWLQHWRWDVLDKRS